MVIEGIRGLPWTRAVPDVPAARTRVPDFNTHCQQGWLQKVRYATRFKQLLVLVDVVVAVWDDRRFERGFFFFF